MSWVRTLKGLGLFLLERKWLVLLPLVLVLLLLSLFILLVEIPVLTPFIYAIF